MSKDTIEENHYFQGEGRFDLIPKNIHVKSTLSRGTKGDRAPLVGLCGGQRSLFGGPGCDQTYDE